MSSNRNFRGSVFIISAGERWTAAIHFHFIFPVPNPTAKNNTGHRRNYDIVLLATNLFIYLSGIFYYYYYYSFLYMKRLKINHAPKKLAKQRITKKKSVTNSEIPRSTSHESTMFGRDNPANTETRCNSLVIIFFFVFFALRFRTTFQNSLPLPPYKCSEASIPTPSQSFFGSCCSSHSLHDSYENLR